MADEIKLIIRMEGRGVTQLKGSVDQLKDSLKQLAKEPGISNNQRQQVAGLRRDLENLINTQARYGKTVQSVNATMFSKNKAGGNVRYGAIGTETLNAINTRKMEDEAKKQLNIQKRLAEKEAEIQRNKRKMMGMAMAGTIGFGGLQIGQQVSGMLENINFSGALAPSLGKALGALGGLLGETFSQVFSNVGSAIGILTESIANLFMSSLKGVFRAVGSLTAGIAMSVISVGLGGPINLVIGAVTGLLMASLSIIQTVLETAVNILKDFVKIVGDLLTAAFALIKGLFSSFASIVSGVWKGIWDGLKATAQAAWDVITAISRTALDQLMKGFEDYAASQKLAARVFSQVSDVAENQGKTMKQGADQYREMSMVLSEKFAVGLNDATMGLYRITSAGITASDSIKAIAETAGTMGVMSQHEDTFESLSNTLLSVTQAYGIAGSEINRYGAIISAATKIGKFDLKQYSAAIQSVIGSASEAKVPFEQLNMILALTSRSGLNLNRVTVGMNRLFDAMTNPTQANAKAFKELKIDIDGMQKSGMSLIDILVAIEDKVPTNKMREMFGTVQGVRAFRAIRSQMGATAEATKRMTEIIQNFGKGMDDALGLAANRMIKTRNAWENFKTSMAGKLLDDTVLAGLDILDEIIGGLVNTVGKMDFSPITKAFSSGMKDIWNTIKQLPAFLGQVLGISVNWDTTIKSIAGYVTQISNYLANPKTWEGLVKGTMKAAAYLEYAYSFIKKMVTDTQLFNDMFSTLGSVIKSIGEFLVEVFKSAFEVAASYAEATLLPVLKEVGLKFGTFLMGGIGDVLSLMGKAIMSMKIEIPTAMKVLNPALALMERSLNDYADMAGGMFVNMGNAAYEKERTMNAVTNEPVGEAGIYRSLKPIIENANEDLINRLISVALKTSVPGMEEGRKRPNVTSDELMAVLNSIKGSRNLEDAQKKLYENNGIFSADTPLLLNKIYLALIDRSKADFVRQGTTNENVQELIANMFPSTRIENERSKGMKKFASTNFSSDMNRELVKLQSSLSTLISTAGPTLKSQNPEALSVLIKQLEDINKIQFQAAEANTKATQDNTNALTRSSEEKTKGKLNKDTRYDKLLPVGQVESYVEKMRKRFPNSDISVSGSVKTGRGYMRMVDVEGTDTNKAVKNSVEAQKKVEKETGGNAVVAEKLDGIATLTKEMVKELKGANRTLMAYQKINGYSPVEPPKAHSVGNLISNWGADVWEML